MVRWPRFLPGAFRRRAHDYSLNKRALCDRLITGILKRTYSMTHLRLEVESGRTAQRDRKRDKPRAARPPMPQELLNLPPAYTVVGIYRLITDDNLRTPIWDKLRHGVQRGAIVGAIWVRIG